MAHPTEPQPAPAHRTAFLGVKLTSIRSRHSQTNREPSIHTGAAFYNVRKLSPGRSGAAMAGAIFRRVLIQIPLEMEAQIGSGAVLAHIRQGTLGSCARHLAKPVSGAYPHGKRGQRQRRTPGKAPLKHSTCPSESRPPLVVRILSPLLAGQLATKVS